MIFYSSASSQHSIATATPITDHGFTVCLWWFAMSSADQALIDFGNPSSANNANRFVVWYRNATGRVQAEGCSSVSADAATALGIVQNSWNFIAARFNTTTSRAVWVNGTTGSATGFVGSPTGITTTTLGATSASSSQSRFTNGIISLPTVWNATLTDEEIRAIRFVIDPTRVRPNAIVAHWDTQQSGSIRRTKRMGYALTDVNAPSKAIDPGFMTKSKQQRHLRSSVAASTFKAHWAYRQIMPLGSGGGMG